MKKISARLLLSLSPWLLSFAAFVPFLSTASAQSSVPNAQLAGKDLNAKVEKLLKQMTLEEKIGQTVQYSVGFATGPQGSKVGYEEMTAKG